MSKKIMAMLLASGIVTSATGAYAAPTFLTRFSPETGAVTLIGEADGYVTVRIADADMAEGTFSEQNLPLVADRIIADGDFNYSLILPDGTPAGKYNVYLRDKNGTTQSSFQFFDADIANTNIIPALNSAKSDNSFEEYTTIIKSSAEKLGIDSEDAVYKEKFSYITGLLYNAVDSFADVSDFCNRYYGIYAIASINGADAEKADDTMKKFAADLGINYETDFLNDSKLTGKTRKSLCKMLSEYDYEKALPEGKTFLEILNSLKPMASVVNASKWQDIEKAMEVDYKDEFKFIFDASNDYKSVANMRTIYAAMMENISSVTSYEDVEALFDSAVEDAISAQSANSSKPSGGGGGGGGGFSAVVMPKDDAELAPQTPTMPQTPVQSKVYTDVNSDFWANEAIQALSVKNAINGYEDGTFKPANLITRAEFIKILTSMLGYEPSDCSFADVSADKWYYGYIGAAVKLGIAKGDGELFNPDSPITRQDAATLLYRAIGQSKNDIAAVSFADEAEISDYASDAVKSLGSVGVLSGYPTGEFFPKNNMTRAEVAQMLYKATKAGLINR